jgi:hypothetical protein
MKVELHAIARKMIIVDCMYNVYIEIVDSRVTGNNALHLSLLYTIECRLGNMYLSIYLYTQHAPGGLAMWKEIIIES